ncbi:EAP30/Vps36 family-domain-containing protein [Pavlovales sp. CCMP2436]|nr:EAP30/Vps36 family-domain-containing protein [Pavlovales sp. CCMP2436]|mmetsp:Transcript_3244/g.8060  ORF Transcript_3244/g.8060 Transcript_3244/m.8060 type:complete len:263 (-) Transcript_3244:94-882(-)
MRRGVGISGLQRQQRHETQLRRVGAELSDQNAAEIQRQLETLRQRIEAFASIHRNTINRDPQFRAAFNRMVAGVGVDPLQSSKGFWAQLLGVGTFYYELSVQVADICMQARASAGGLIALDELHRKLVRARADRVISKDDVLCAVGQLRKLGGGYTVLRIGTEEYIRSVPSELDEDGGHVLAMATATAHVTRSQLMRERSWTAERAEEALSGLLREGVVWIDAQAGAEPEYWVPCIWQRQVATRRGVSTPGDEMSTPAPRAG